MSTAKRYCVVVGTRPEIIKTASVIKELQRRSLDFVIVHSSQHYDRELSGIFFEELGLPPPGESLHVGSASPVRQVSSTMARLENVLERLSPQVILAQGDTNTALAASLTANKMGILLGHIEAGLRSHDYRMPEEHNRMVADHLADLLFAPTDETAENLKREGCRGAVHVTGNTVIDACCEFSAISEKNAKVRNSLSLSAYALVTLHRAENVDNPRTLLDLVEILTRCPIPVVWPVHPRARARMESTGILEKFGRSSHVHLISPVGYIDFLDLMKHSSFILTDSGGIQEEATAPVIAKKVFVLRESTERPEAVKAGFAEIVGTGPNHVINRISLHLQHPWIAPRLTPFGDGAAGYRIVAQCEKEIS